MTAEYIPLPMAAKYKRYLKMECCPAGGSSSAMERKVKECAEEASTLWLEDFARQDEKGQAEDKGEQS